MTAPQERLIRKLQEHSVLSDEEKDALKALPFEMRLIPADFDIVLQGSKPTVSIVVLQGMLARYHLLTSGKRQYLSFHLPGDMPDAQCLFLEEIDHSLASIGEAVIALVPHPALIALCRNHPGAGFAIWRETLIDAAMFRKSITLNSSKDTTTRLAHLFCEVYYRSRVNGTAKPGHCPFPLTQSQIGETLGMSLVSVTRAFAALKKDALFSVGAGTLTIQDWNGLQALAEFDPSYLHIRKAMVKRDLA